jgi:hypothetical protein
MLKIKYKINEIKKMPKHANVYEIHFKVILMSNVIIELAPSHKCVNKG